jgi:hypothetical protein
MSAIASIWLMNRRKARCGVGPAVVAAFAIGVSATAQTPPAGGQVVVPGSSVAKPGDSGVRAHTNTLIFVPNGASRLHPSQPRSAASPVATPPCSKTDCGQR